MAAGLSVDLNRWRQEFDELMLRVGARFARVEPRRRMAAFVRGLLAGLPRGNCGAMGGHARGGSGVRPGCGMTCVVMCWSISLIPARSWSWTRQETSRKAANADVGITGLMPGPRLCRGW